VTALETRARDLTRLAEEPFDLVVVGGGITGAGVLLDAASRGLRAALIERDDLASGTSSRSSKLIHGGLRYLEHLRFGLVREALAERAVLLRTAGHLVRLAPFLAPVYGSPLQVPYLGAGMTLYGLLGAARDGGFPRYLRPSSARRVHQHLRPEGLRGGFVYHDGVDDDSRLVVTVARTALASGAVAVTRVRATALLTEGGRVCGLDAQDVLDGTALRVTTRTVIDATGATGGAGGPFAAEGGGARVTPSLGSHLVVARDRIPGEVGLTIRVPGRVVFLVPWGRFWIIGTTDHPYSGPTDRPRAPGADVDELLGAINATMDVGLRREDLIATYAGVRPLAGDDSGSTVSASREHVIGEPVPGLITIRGGKYTTYRRIAMEVVDRATGRKGSRTDELPLLGAGGAQPGADEALDGLRGRYGGEASEVRAFARERSLEARLHAGSDVIEAEVAWAVEREQALSLDDILARRLRLAIQIPDHGASVARRAAAIVAPLLGWDDARAAAEAATYVESATAEYGIP
jgi:glycerol-3-phosphate dehydrogenase